MIKKKPTPNMAQKSSNSRAEAMKAAMSGAKKVDKGTGITGKDMSSAMAGTQKVWDSPNPKGKSKKLTPKKKASAKAMAKAAGRPYPNLIDNMRAAKKKK